jgi:hypothetical protein
MSLMRIHPEKYLPKYWYEPEPTEPDGILPNTKCDIFSPDEINQIMATKINKRGSLFGTSGRERKFTEILNIHDYTSIDVFG